MKTIKYQRGVTPLGWLFILAMIAVVALLALKIIPIYLDGFNVYSAIESLEDDANMRGKSRAEMRKLIMRRLDLNYVYGVTKDDIYITQQKNVYVIEVDYERRENIIGNMDIAVTFNKKVEIPRK